MGDTNWDPTTIHQDADGSGPILAGCPTYSRRFKTRDAAERWVERVAIMGACEYDHMVLDPTTDV